MIRVVCFDLDGVLRLWDGSLITQIEREACLPAGTIHSVAFEPGLLEQAITGRMRDEEWRDATAERLWRQFPSLTRAHADALIQRWSSSVGAVDERVLAMIRDCRRHVRVLLVSNATSRLSSDLAQLGIGSEFDAVINSADVGWRKPQQEIFQEAIHRAGVSAAEILFVDDTHENVEAAEKAGLVGFEYQDTMALYEVLQGYGVL